MKMLRVWSVVAVLASASVVSRAEEFKITGDAAKGAEAYKMYCVVCHGETGHGDGVGSAALPPPKPRNLSEKAYMDTLSDEHIFKVIKEGGPSVGKSMFMTAWGAILKTDEAVHDVAAYVRTLAKE
jgi:cytochrome c553